ncbi:SUR7/PalI family protein [Hirsutella rhossiliensis]|uniref:SUR7/PalI family domain-containing protein n=1 Tax=Hirsutella rhossiliensis TaxID=111463 RepID=A0A9P8MZ83_9HYPO|nr:SUR7/PalI family domain-containing protein [Hirsutella rhossiliensis]KAH0963954.1 SUR7/PalI family domain-containing protein [Hirsutella rhossiliensis]
MAKNASLGLGALALLAGSLVMLFFVILSGVTDTTPLDKTYFLRADTKGITGARDTTQWTYFYMCGLDNQDCGMAHAAPPLGYAWGANADNAPAALVGSHGGETTSFKFFYLWRFGWVFLIMTLFFEIMAFFTSFLACCGRLGSAIAFFVATIALLCSAVGVSLMTVTFVQARNRFLEEGRDASLGRYAFGFLWGSFAVLLIANVLFGLGMRGGKDRSGDLWRKRSTRSARSHRSRSYDGRRVKDDYS